MDRSDLPSDNPTVSVNDNPTLRGSGAPELPAAESAGSGAPAALPLWRRVVRGLATMAVTLAAMIVVLTLAYRYINPPLSTLMILDLAKGNGFTQTWVPIEQISPNVIKAVVMSEDAFFCEHWGVDWTAMRDAWEQGGRGASTIPMQTVKNLFLWPGRHYVRKVIELPLTYLASFIWPKRRMLEIYLNIAEWGPGIYGVEAAARHHFNTSAASLTPGQASLLAASLPNPYTRKAGAPNSKTRNQAARVRKRIGDAEDYLRCVLPAR